MEWILNCYGNHNLLSHTVYKLQLKHTIRVKNIVRTFYKTTNIMEIIDMSDLKTISMTVKLKKLAEALDCFTRIIVGPNNTFTPYK